MQLTSIFCSRSNLALDGQIECNAAKSVLNLFHALFWFLAAPASEPRVYTMIGCSLVLICLSGYAIILHISMCESCDPIYLNKLEGIGPLYHETQGPENASKSLSVCSHWCLAKASCKFLSWNPCSCWQVVFLGLWWWQEWCTASKRTTLVCIWFWGVHICIYTCIYIYVYTSLYIHMSVFMDQHSKHYTVENHGHLFTIDIDVWGIHFIHVMFHDCVFCIREIWSRLQIFQHQKIDFLGSNIWYIILTGNLTWCW